MIKQYFQKFYEMYKNIFIDIIGDCNLEYFDGNVIQFENQKPFIINGNIIIYENENRNLKKYIKIETPDLKEDIKAVKVSEYIREKRFNQYKQKKCCVLEIKEKIYGKSKFSKNTAVLTDLVSKRYVFDKNLELSSIFNSEILKKDVKMKTVFESHMNYIIQSNDSKRSYTDSIYSTKTLVNGEDISSIYDTVEGLDKIARIHDLYMGMVNERNASDLKAMNMGLLDQNAFAYKNNFGFTELENYICGDFIYENPYDQDYNFIYKFIHETTGYPKEFDCSDLDSVYIALMYHDKNREYKQIIREKVEKTIGIPYGLFENLDSEQQEKILNFYKKTKKTKDETIEQILKQANQRETIYKTRQRVLNFLVKKFY